MKSNIRYVVMVNTEFYHHSISYSKAGAETYLHDARMAASEGAEVRVVKLTITEIPKKKKK